MPGSLFSPEFQAVLSQARQASGQPGGAFPSPADWRDQWIYFLMVDRFNNKNAAPRHQPFDDPDYFDFQGGKFSGIQAQLPYLKGLGVGAIWLSPALKNFQFEGGTYHGYGIHDFLHADPRFADDPEKADDELRALVDAAHALGIYVVLDIVLNHTGNAFAYVCDAGEQSCTDSGGAEAGFRASPREVRWRDETGAARPDFADVGAIANPPGDALVWPAELQSNEFYRRQGTPQADGDDTVGDFASLKQFRTDNREVQRLLIRAYQYVIARFDIDGYRIDTLRYLKNGLPRLFGNAMREFALSIGKKNFFTFGEVFVPDAEEQIARFIGRTTADQDDIVGVDAALDYPLFDRLKPVVKGFAAPAVLVDMYKRRKDIEKEVLSSHGDATRYFVTFLDNHDVKERIRFVEPGDPTKFDNQVLLGLTCLYCLPGVPCLYYGTEQGLHGQGSDAAVREAIWGSPGFDRNSMFYQQIARIAAARSQSPALRYGRFYFRPISGDGVSFGVSGFTQGVLAFSRILDAEEVIIVANTSPTETSRLEVIVDSNLNAPGSAMKILYCNQAAPANPGAVQFRAANSVQVQEVGGGVGTGPLHSFAVTLRPMEVQVVSS